MEEYYRKHKDEVHFPWVERGEDIGGAILHDPSDTSTVELFVAEELL